MPEIDKESRETRSCPLCHYGQLHRVAAGTSTNHFCPSCTACWHPEQGGRLRLVRRERCAGCAEQLCRSSLGGPLADVAVGSSR